MAAASSLVVDRIDLVEMTHNESQVSPITGNTHQRGNRLRQNTRAPSIERASLRSLSFSLGFRHSISSPSVPSSFLLSEGIDRV